MALLGNLTGSSQFFNDPDFYNEIATQSLRFDDGSSAYLYRTPSSASNRRTFTFSAWIKRGVLDANNVGGSNDTPIISAGASGGDATTLRTLSQLTAGANILQLYTSVGATDYSEETNASIRDTSQWYHIVMAVDTTQSTAGNRVKFYINGTLQTAVGQYYAQVPEDYDTFFNNDNVHWIGRNVNSTGRYFDGYMAEVNFVDGTQVAASSFGETKNGVWIPKKYTGSYGTEGYRLEFKNTSVSSGSASTIGADTSGNDNHFTSSGIAASDCNMPDCPENNFATLNPLDNDSMTLSEGNLSAISPANAHNATGTTFGVTGGKWYWEIRSGGTGSNYFFGMGKTTFSFISQYTNDAHNFGDLWCVATDGQKANGSGESSYGSALSSGDILQLAFDLDNGKFWAGKNGTYYASGDPAAGSNAAFTNVPTDEHMMPFYGNSTSGLAHIFNFGQDSSFAGAETAQGNKDSNGIGDFYYAPPSGFLALCSSNLSEPTISPNSLTQADDHFDILTWTATASGHIIHDRADGAGVGLSFKPDLIWGKKRASSGDNHVLVDSSRGSTKELFANTADDEETNSNGVSSFDAPSSSGATDGGFTLVGSGSGSGTWNGNSGHTHVAWNWKANGGTTTTNDASATSVGTIDSVYQANTTAGFSIVTYTGTGSNATVAHGLGATPAMVIYKIRDTGTSWAVWHKDLATPTTGLLELNSNGAELNNASYWNSTIPTSTVLSIGTYGGVNASSPFIAYCFADIEGYSKFANFTGNGNADGTFVYTGFRPAWVLIKNTDRSADWRLHDIARQPTNDSGGHILLPNSNSTEVTNEYDMDFLSNGFKLRSGDVYENGSGELITYAAFAEQPFKYANAK